MSTFVYGNARVFGNTQIYGSATIHGPVTLGTYDGPREHLFDPDTWMSLCGGMFKKTGGYEYTFVYTNPDKHLTHCKACMDLANGVYRVAYELRECDGNP